MFRHLSSLYINIYIPFSTSSLSSIAKKLNSTMKQLIDLKQYEKALNFFQDQCQFRTDISINMALKACAELRNYQRGIGIEKQLLPSSLNDPFIQTTLMYFYSELHFFYE